MQLVRDFAQCPAHCKGAVVALGNFDGVHLGHQAILRTCVETARAAGVPAAVMTFEPHPREFFSKTHERLRIYPLRQKLVLMREMGLDIVYLIRFNRQFASNTAQQFVEDILHRTLKVKHIITGYNFAFGKGRGGNTDFLSAQSAALGFGFTACKPVQAGAGTAVSSSAIREALAAGEVQKASQMLGRPYEIAGRVQAGHQRGRELGFPTANLALEQLFKPRFGVYAVRIATGSRWYDGVANLGVRPTFGQNEPVLEVHGFDLKEKLYGHYVRVRLAGFLRDERRFDNAEALKTQIAADCSQAAQVLKNAEHLHATGT